jgi:pSer/pThr/pTyr-binding forkhead associated (FHA) protein
VPPYVEIWNAQGSQRVALEGNQLSIGRDKSNDVTLPDDPTVSRRHALLERLAAGWSISDLNSLNGTLVNGEPLGQARPLYSGDEIEIGETRLVYHHDDRRPPEGG